MRVCFVSGNIYPVLSERERRYRTIGGAEVQQCLIAHQLVGHGVVINFVSEDFGQGSFSKSDGLDVHGYRFSSNKLIQAATLCKAMHKAQADIYLVRGVPNFLSIVLAFCLLHRRKLILSMSTNQTVLPRRISGLPLLAYIPFRLSMRWASAIVAQTKFQKAMLERNFKAKDIVLIPNGALPSCYDISSSNKPDRVVWLASMHPRKGPELLLDLARSMPEMKFQIGGGPWRGLDDYYERLRGQSESLENVEWLGYVPHDCVDKVLSGALALVNTTQPMTGLENVEGFPNVYLEAWRNGVPTLTLYNDPDEVICENGLGFHTPNLQGLSISLRLLSGDSVLRQQMGLRARRHFETYHAISDVAVEYLNLIQSLYSRA